DASPVAVIAAEDDPVFALAPAAAHIAASALRDVAAGADPLPDTAAAEPALLLYTSGTTGKPKGVLHAHRVLLGHHAIDLALDRVRPSDVAHSPVDWTWAGGLLLGLLVPLAHGITVVAHREPRFDPATTFELMRRTGVSVGLFPPTVLRMLRASGVMTASTVSGTRLRCFVTGAEAVEPELLAWGREVGVTINNAYGQTEANALVGHAATLAPCLDQASMGRPYPGHRIAVLDDDLCPVDDGMPGQLAVADDDLVCMLEYWNNPEATAAKRRGGWLLTGDTVDRRTDGTLRFHGRNDDIIKSGAYRLGPAEIEAAILRHDEVAECAAVGVPDDIRGEVVVAVVRLRTGAEVEHDELTAALQHLVRTEVGAHAYPRLVRVVDELPRTTTNKVDRAAVRRSMLEGAR
ncbi:MAG: AMP-binding protein, partial [Ilumatobacteraceae bacterium]